MTRVGMVVANGLTHPPSMTIFVQLIYKKCHPKSYHGDTKCHMTHNTIFNVVYFHLEDFLKYECELYLKQH